MLRGPVFVVGYGNSMRGDDGVGQEVAEALWLQRDHVPELAGANFIWAEQLTPELALDLSHSGFAVFADAAGDGRMAGSVTLQMLDVGAPARARACMRTVASGCWQDLTPTGLLVLALDLYGAAPPAVLVTVGVAALDLGIGLSPVVRAAVPRAAAVARLAIAVSRWRDRPQARPSSARLGWVPHA